MNLRNSEIIAEYDNAENNGLSKLTNSAIMAFRPAFWRMNGFPIKINDLSELWRYHDSMHDNRYNWHKECISKCNCSKDDLLLLEKISDLIVSFTKELNFPIISPAQNALTRAFYQYLRIKEYTDKFKKEKTVFEIGPGTGYLGIFLRLKGYKYIALEITQSYYIYQSLLWQFIFKDEYNNGIDPYNNQPVRHITWWEFNKLYFKPPSFDILTSNHVFAEMHPIALKRVLNFFQLSTNNNCLGISDGLGHNYNDHKKVVKAFYKARINIKEIYADTYIFYKAKENEKVFFKRSFRRLMYQHFYPHTSSEKLNFIRNYMFKFLQKIKKIIIFFKIEKGKNIYEMNTTNEIDRIFEKYVNFETLDSIYLESKDLKKHNSINLIR